MVEMTAIYRDGVLLRKEPCSARVLLTTDRIWNIPILRQRVCFPMLLLSGSIIFVEHSASNAVFGGLDPQ